MTSMVFQMRMFGPINGRQNYKTKLLSILDRGSFLGRFLAKLSSFDRIFLIE